MDNYQKAVSRYKKRKILGIVLTAAGCLTFVLTILFMFALSGFKTLSWTEYHTWSAGLGSVLVAAGGILMSHSILSLRNIEHAVNLLNPDERELAIAEKAKAKGVIIYITFIFPAMFITSSVLILTKTINLVAWIIILLGYLALPVTVAIIKRMLYKKY